MRKTMRKKRKRKFQIYRSQNQAVHWVQEVLAVRRRNRPHKLVLESQHRLQRTQRAEKDLQLLDFKKMMRFNDIFEAFAIVFVNLCPDLWSNIELPTSCYISPPPTRLQYWRMCRMKTVSTPTSSRVLMVATRGPPAAEPTAPRSLQRKRKHLPGRHKVASRF